MNSIEPITDKESALATLRANFLHGYLALRKAHLRAPNGCDIHVIQEDRHKSGAGVSELRMGVDVVASFKTFRGCPVRTEQSRFIQVMERIL